jgi:hypothetical protein
VIVRRHRSGCIAAAVSNSVWFRISWLMIKGSVTTDTKSIGPRPRCFVESQLTLNQMLFDVRLPKIKSRVRPSGSPSRNCSQDALALPFVQAEFALPLRTAC